MHQLLKNIDKIIEAPNGIEKLRQTVLQLAVQGKLVEQDPNDEPASELLKKIKAEKVKQIIEGKTKKQYEPIPIKEIEALIKLPKGWAVEKIGNILSTTSGGTPSRVNNIYWGGKIPWLKSGELNDNINITSSEEFITEEGLNNSSAKMFTKGSVIMALYGATAGKVGILGFNTTTNQAVCCFHTNQFIFNQYLYYFLLASRSKILNECFGAAQPNISQDYVKKMLFILPPLAEQQRIVEKVNELMNLINELANKKETREQKKITLNISSIDKLLNSKTREEQKQNWKRINTNFNILYSQKENVDKLKQAILQLAVQGKLVEQDPNDEPASELLKKIKVEKVKLVAKGKIKKQPDLTPIKDHEKPFELPKSWEWARLDSLGETQTGTTPTTNDSSNYGDFIPFIGPGDILNHQINYKNNGLSKSGISKGRLISKHSIMMVCIGGSIGKAAINEIDVSCNQQINVITPYIFETLCFLFYSLIGPYFQSEIINKASGSATPIINKHKWSNLVVPLPPLSEQNRIVEKVKEFISLCNKLEQNLKLKTQEQEMLVNSIVNKIV
jgi:type I restriction enzyme S subunit